MGEAAERKLVTIICPAYNEAAVLTRNLDTLQRTTRSGVDGRTYEARSTDDLRALARERGIDDPTRLDRSELVSQLRDAPEADV